MSSIETHYGKITEIIRTDEPFIDQMRDIARANGGPGLESEIELRDFFIDNDEDFFVDWEAQRIFKIISHKELDDGEDLIFATEDNGVISFAVSFYNGGKQSTKWKRNRVESHQRRHQI